MCSSDLLLVHLDQPETMLPPSVLAMILVGEKPRERRQLLCALPRHHVGEVHVLTGPQEAPRRSVVRAGALLGGVESSETEPHAAARPNLGGVGAGDARGRRGNPYLPGGEAAWWRGGGVSAAKGDEEMEKAAEGAVIYRRVGRGSPNVACELPPFSACAQSFPAR